MQKKFILKDGKSLEITESTINHIVEGDLVIRPMRNQKNMTVISGGLHTYDGWIKFKQEYAGKLSHLRHFDTERHDFWYYSRTLSNGVITLRLPRDFFTGRAAKMTMYPDDYYKSGYLWKTLFPKGYGKEEVLEAVEEALKNEDINQRSKGRIVGYINNDDPLLKIEVTIQHRNKQVKSAFPSWGQPNTGNNGKPYSHFDVIGFIIAQSTEYFDDSLADETNPLYTFPGHEIPVEELAIHTPKIFTSRARRSLHQTPSKWAEQREEELRNFTTTPQENNKIITYLKDFNLVKHYPELTTGVYASKAKQLREDNTFNNTFQIIQNFKDGLNYLHHSKQREELIDATVYMLKNMVTNAPFDFFEKKKILSTMIRIVSSEKNPKLSYFFVESLSRSPIRREAFLEYNIDSLIKKRLSLPIHNFPEELVFIENPTIDIDIRYGDFIEILKEVFGETYTLNFEEDELTKLLEEIVGGQSHNFKDLIIDRLALFSREDLISLSDSIDDILASAYKYTAGSKKSLIESTGLILRDYCRIQFAHRQRINARYMFYHDFTKEIYTPIDKNLLFGLILKHEQWRNFYKTENFINKIVKFSNYASDIDLKNDANNFLTRIGKERPPLPKN